MQLEDLVSSIPLSYSLFVKQEHKCLKHVFCKWPDSIKNVKNKMKQVTKQMCDNLFENFTKFSWEHCLDNSKISGFSPALSLKLISLTGIFFKIFPNF